MPPPSEPPPPLDCPGFRGETVEGYEYQQFETGVRPFWTPLRFPGQYHDAETDLFENWNRYYDPSIGRYLGPEPMYTDPKWVLKQIASGVSPGIYSYGQNNPVLYVDPDGLSFLVFGERLQALLEDFKKKNPEVYDKMLSSDNMYVVMEKDLKSSRGIKKGETDGTTMYLDLKQIDSDEDGHSALWTLAHEARHAMENGGQARRSAPWVREIVSDELAKETTGEPFSDADRKYWQYMLDLEKAEQQWRERQKQKLMR